MRGISLKRRKLIGIGAGLAVVPAWWALRQEANGAKADWRTDTTPLERAFPLLGPLTDAQWVSSRDGDDRGGTVAGAGDLGLRPAGTGATRRADGGPRLRLRGACR